MFVIHSYNHDKTNLRSTVIKFCTLITKIEENNSYFKFKHVVITNRTNVFRRNTSLLNPLASQAPSSILVCNIFNNN